MRISGAEMVMKILLEQGVDTVFGYPGAAVLKLYDELYRYSGKIRHIITAHEQNAAHAADGYARASGKTGVVIATSGPGAANLVTGIATAFMDSVPLVTITGNVATSMIGKDSFQEVYTQGITMPITKHNFTVHKIEHLVRNLRSAFRIAQSGRKGPVLVDIPKDILSSYAEFEPDNGQALPDAKIKRPTYDQNDIDRAAALINSAMRPVIYYGGGISLAGAQSALSEFSKKSGIPSCHTLMATGAVSMENELGLAGMYGRYSANKAVEQCDLLLALGVRFSDRMVTCFGDFAPNAKIVHIDIDPSELNKNVHAQESIIGDIGDILRRIIEKTEEKQHDGWMSEIDSFIRFEENRSHAEASDGRIHPHALMREISRKRENRIITTDVGQHQIWAAQYLENLGERSFLTSGGLGTMGFGLGAAIGACFALPGRGAIHITGDGSFHMNLIELCTAELHRLPIVTVILNNSALGMVRQWQYSLYGQRYSATSPGWNTDFVKVANGFGVDGCRVDTMEQFSRALDHALESGGPYVIDCAISEDERTLPIIHQGDTVEKTCWE